MHGEYKVPGGKLVVIDLDVIDGYFRNVELSGDFFLEPDEALEWMTAAIEGAPANLDEGMLAERIQIAAQNAELLGITPVGVAIAIKRALQGDQS